MNVKMKAAQISKAGGEWELVEREIPEPRAGQVRVKVEACGICNSDVLVKEGLWPATAVDSLQRHSRDAHLGSSRGLEGQLASVTGEWSWFEPVGWDVRQ